MIQKWVPKQVHTPKEVAKPEDQVAPLVVPIVEGIENDLGQVATTKIASH